MSQVAARMGRPEAVEIAKAFVGLIEGCTDQLIVAGSLRRRLAYIGDIEVCAVPKIETVETDIPDLFGGQPHVGQVDLLDAHLTMLLDKGRVAKRLDANGTPRWGETLKYLTFQGARVDLFTPCAERFGWILLLRTGPAAFSRQLVVPKRDDNGRPGRTKDRRPGLLPVHIKPVDGWLCYRTSGERIPTPTEQSVFELFGMPYQEPWERV
jgi:DNA polymerase/3'-5' exonuclease PolX